MLRKIIVDNEVIKKLMERINLTESQLDKLLIHKNNKNLSFKEKGRLRDGGIVSKGSFVRTLSQAHQNIRRTLYTMIVLEYFLVLKTNDINNLVKIGSLLKMINKEGISDEKKRLIVKNVLLTLDRIKMD